MASSTVLHNETFSGDNRTRPVRASSLDAAGHDSQGRGGVVRALLCPWARALVGLLAALILLPVSAALSAEDATEVAMDHARVSRDDGGLLIRGAETEADDAWAFAPLNTLVLPGDTLWMDDAHTGELELPHGIFVRLADGARLQVIALGDLTQLHGAAGSFYLQRGAAGTGGLIFQTPAGQIEVMPASAVRIDLSETGATAITVRQGQARVRGESGEPVAVAEGHQRWLDPGLLPSPMVTAAAQGLDDFDRWHLQRVRELAEAQARSAPPPRVALRADALGVAELADHGQWLELDGDWVWRPVGIADYVPYRHGHWTAVASMGQVWVGRYPFCHITSHYGTWSHSARHGWVWRYHGVWSPAWATAIHYQDHYLWTPVDRWHRPVQVAASAGFTVGGLHFSLHAVSYAPVVHIHHGPIHVRPLPSRVVHHIHHHGHQVHLWHLGPRHRHAVRVPYRGIGSAPWGERPARPVRGPARIAQGSSHVDARQRATWLERRVDPRPGWGQERGAGRSAPSWTGPGTERHDDHRSHASRRRPVTLAPSERSLMRDTPWAHAGPREETRPVRQSPVRSEGGRASARAGADGPPRPQAADTPRGRGETARGPERFERSERPPHRQAPRPAPEAEAATPRTMLPRPSTPREAARPVPPRAGTAPSTEPRRTPPAFTRPSRPGPTDAPEAHLRSRERPDQATPPQRRPRSDMTPPRTQAERAASGPRPDRLQRPARPEGRSPAGERSSAARPAPDAERPGVLPRGERPRAEAPRPRRPMQAGPERGPRRHLEMRLPDGQEEATEAPRFRERRRGG